MCNNFFFFSFYFYWIRIHINNYGSVFPTHMPLGNIFGDKLYMALLFWYILKLDLSNVRYMYSSVLQCNFLQGTRTTRPCLSGRVEEEGGGYKKSYRSPPPAPALNDALLTPISHPFSFSFYKSPLCMHGLSKDRQIFDILHFKGKL